MTKEKMIENYKNGVYNDLHGGALFQIDLDDLVQNEEDLLSKIELLEYQIDHLNRTIEVMSEDSVLEES